MVKDKVTVEIKNLLPPKKAAEYLGVSVMTLWRWRQEGKLTPVLLDHPYYHIKELRQIKKEREKENKKKATTRVA